MIGTATQECFPTWRSSSASAANASGSSSEVVYDRPSTSSSRSASSSSSRVGLVGRAPLLPGGELAGVDDHPEHARVGLPAGDRERVGADRDARLVGGELDEIVELLDGRHGRGDRDQRVQLALEPARVAVALGRRQEIGEVGLDRARLDGAVGAEAAEQRVDHGGVELRPGAPLELGDGLVDRRAPGGTAGRRRAR